MNFILEIMDFVYRAFIIKFAENLRVSDKEYFRYWCKGTLSESQLEDLSVVDIVRGLERADKMSCHNLGFLKDFLLRISHIQLYNELLRAEVDIECIQTMAEYTHLESKHQAYNSETNPFRVAQVLLQMNERNDKLSKIIRKITTSEAYREIYKALSKEMSDLLRKKDDVTWEKVQLLFAGCCKLEAAVHDSLDFNEKWRTELRRLLSRLIVCLGGWDDFVQNVKNESSEVTEPDSVMQKELQDAIYNGNILVQNQQKSCLNTSQSVLHRACKGKPYDRVTKFLHRPFHLSLRRSLKPPQYSAYHHEQRAPLLVLRHD